MGVIGLPFIFNGIPSEFYECSMVFLYNDSTKRESGDGRTFTTIKPLRSARQSVLDVQIDQPLSFPIEIVFNNPVDMYTLSKVKSWLASPLNFCKLQVCSDLFDQYYWNCYITLSEDLTYAGGYRGVTGTVVCDSPWAWSIPRDLSLTVGETIKFLNDTQDCQYMRPKLSFTTGATDSFIALEVYNDELTYDITFIMDGLPGHTREYVQADGSTISYSVPSYATRFTVGETTTFDSYTGLFTTYNSSGKIVKDAHRAAIFNKQFILIPQGYMNIKLTGSLISNVNMNYQIAKRIGGAFY